MNATPAVTPNQGQTLLTSSPLDLENLPSPLAFRDISPLPFITVRRGLARFRVKPYSVEHAYLTGHTGTPTRPKQQSIAFTPALLTGTLSYSP